jgi:hypothetical protein
VRAVPIDAVPIDAVPIDDWILPLLALMAVLSAGVAMVYLPWPGVRRAVTRYGLLGIGAMGAYAVFAVPFLVLAHPVAARVTQIAGNPPVNAADSDTITALFGLPIGVVFGLFLAEHQERAEREPQSDWIPTMRAASGEKF